MTLKTASRGCLWGAIVVLQCALECCSGRELTVNQTVDHRCLFTINSKISKLLNLLDSQSKLMPRQGN